MSGSRIVWTARTDGEMRTHEARIDGERVAMMTRSGWKTLSPWRVSVASSDPSLWQFIASAWTVREGKASVTKFFDSDHMSDEAERRAEGYR